MLAAEKNFTLDEKILDFVGENVPDEYKWEGFEAANPRLTFSVYIELFVKQKYDLIKKYVKQTFEARDETGLETIIKNYDKLSNTVSNTVSISFSHEQIKTLGEYIISRPPNKDHPLDNYLLRTRDPDNIRPSDSLAVSLTGLIGHFFDICLNEGRRDKAEQLAFTVAHLGWLNKSMEFYQQLGLKEDKDKLVDLARSIFSQGNYDSTGIHRILKQMDKGDGKLIRKFIDDVFEEMKKKKTEINLEALIEYASFVDYCKPLEEIGDLIANLPEQKQNKGCITGLAYGEKEKAIEKLQAIKKETGYKGIDKSLETIAYDCIFKEDKEKPEPNCFYLAAKGVKLDKKKILERTDKSAKRWMPKFNAENSDPMGKDISGCQPSYNSCFFYEEAGLSKEESIRRLANISLEVGNCDLALVYFEALGNNQKMYKIGLRQTEKGELAKALTAFKKANLENINTDDKRFYNVIGDATLSLYLRCPDFNPKIWKKTINQSIKPDTIKSIELKKKGDDLELKVDFGSWQYCYIKEGIKAKSRNQVEILTKSRTCKRNTVMKSYKGPEAEKRQKAEAFWLQFFEGKIPVKRLIYSGKFNGHFFNEIEKCNGQRLLEIVKNSNGDVGKLYQQAIELSLDMYRATRNKQDEIKNELEQRGIEYKLTYEYMDKRFKSVARHLKGINTPLAREVLAELPEIEDEAQILLSNKPGIIPADYSVRNLMVENGVIIPFDFECFMEGHPISPVISLLTYPASPYCFYGNGQGNFSELERASRNLWAVKQANGIGQDKKRSQTFNWFLKTLIENRRGTAKW